MRPVAAAAVAAALVLMAGLTAGLAVASAPQAAASPAADGGLTASASRAGGGGGSGGGGCDPYVDGTVIPVPCSSGGGSGSGSGSGGSPGSGGGGSVNNTCTFVTLDEAQAKNLGLNWPPPHGKHWALMTCIGGATGTTPQAVLVSNATGRPQVTPQQLLVQALRELHVPYLSPATAPPRGTDGLVGLPEWFWVPAGQWHVRAVTVSAGLVWATARARPVGLTITPGPGLRPVSCTGPGTAYDRQLAAARQHTDCSYTYLRSSDGQPGGGYPASVTVTWRVSWTGSGGAGGLLDPALAVPVDFTVPVAQGEALVTSP